jgi:hypothetical protein
LGVLSIYLHIDAFQKLLDILLGKGFRKASKKGLEKRQTPSTTLQTRSDVPFLEIYEFVKVIQDAAFVKKRIK